MYFTPVVKSVCVTGSSPRIALTNSSSTRHAPRFSSATSISVKSPAPRVAPDRRKLGLPGSVKLVDSTRITPSVPWIQRSSSRANAETIVTVMFSEPPHSMPQRMSIWSGIEVERRLPVSSTRCLTTVWPDAWTVFAGPNQRISASYQIPIVMMLFPEKSRLCRQCKGKSGFGKSLPFATCNLTLIKSPM